MNVDLAVSLLLALMNNAGKISALITKAQAEGRTDLSEDEWDSIINSDEAAKLKQMEALARAEAEGR